MQRSLILVGVAGLVGVGLAVVLLLNMDSGETVPERSRTQGEVSPVTAAAPTPTAPVPSKPLLRRPGSDPDMVSKLERMDKSERPYASHPRAQEGIERRAEPDAVAAGRSAAPWSLVRRQLLQSDDPDAQTFLDESAKIITELRQARRAPDSVDFEALEFKQDDLARRIRRSSLGEDPSVVGALDRLDGIYKEYHQQMGE